MANPSITEEKQACRRLAQRRLRDLAPSRRKRSSEQVVKHLVAWLVSCAPSRPAVVATYSAIGNEVDLGTLPGHLPSLSLVYPRVMEEGLAFFEVQERAEMLAGVFGIQEPDPARHRRVEPGAIDICLCPGLAFAPDGARLGRGKGYYDRLLAALRPEVPRVGVGFTMQNLDRLPRESHDLPMTHLLTEEGLRLVG